MDIVKCCCCCCFGPKPEQDTSDVYTTEQKPSVVSTATPPPPPTILTIPEPPKEEENEVDMSSTPPVTMSTNTATPVEPPKQQQNENEVDMTSMAAVADAITTVEVGPASKVTLRAPHEANAGSTIDVEWTYHTSDLEKEHNSGNINSNNNTDMIAIYPQESTVRSNFTYTRNGTPAKLVLPTQPGWYTIAYVSGNDQLRLGSSTITVLSPPVSLSAPDTAHVGATITVQWVGPNEPSDAIAISPINSKVRSNYTYTSTGTPCVQLLLPTQPGSYQIHYMSGQDHTIFATIPIQLLPVEATLMVPTEATIGSTILVEWNGPNYLNDHIAIYELHQPRLRIHYTYTSTGNPVKLLMPTKVGTFDIKYVIGQDNSIVTSTPINIVSVEATISGPLEGHIGSIIEVPWTGPNESGDYICINKVGRQERAYYAYTSSGNPVHITLPTSPGLYELKYCMGQNNTVLTTSPITVVAIEATLSAPTEGRAGSNVDVSWTGPDNAGDYIGICKMDAKESLHHAYTSSGNPANLALPTKPGSYEFKYFIGQDDSVLARSPFTVVEVQATLSGPTEGRVGSVIEVPWSGPDNTGDYIGISKMGAKESLHHAYTSSGNPAMVTLPTKPGLYELKYYMGQDGSVIARSTFKVVEVQATLSAPPEGQAGSTIEVPWSGPDNSGDYIGISKMGAKESLHHAYTFSGNPAYITLPTKPGSYELKYYMGQDDSVLVKAPINVIAVQATLSGPTECNAGSTIEVSWSGPDNSGDYIGVSQVGAKESLHHAYTSNGNPAYITLPTKPGSYELKYFMGQDDTVLGKSSIAVAAVQATLSGPSEGRAGSTIEISWSGPDHSGDYIGISKIGVTESLQHTYTSSGNPAYLTLPTKSGPYELKYYMGQDNTILTRAAITITAATATLSSPTSGKVGSTVEVEWSGPDDSGDYIGICPTGKNDSLEYVYTSYGNPISLTLPTDPGAYEMKYFVGQDSSVLVSVPFTVTKD